MDSDGLLAVSPKLLAQAILHRRERLAELIPVDLEARKSELAEAEPAARSARKERDEINVKVASLKKERNDAQKKARALFEKANEIREALIEAGGIKNPDPKWAKEKLAEKLSAIERELETQSGTHKTEERYINEMKALIKEHEGWVEERSASQPLVKEMREAQSAARKLLDSSQKAHSAMAELVDANAVRHDSYVHWEEVRRRSASRTKKLDAALLSSQSALEFWKGRIDSDGFADLIEDSERVRSGGPSSKAIARAAKVEREAKSGKEAKSRGEEE
jgi:DNA repair exonuclease SbcCD ATPase subunit